MHQPSAPLSLHEREQLDRLAEQFEAAFVAGKRPAIEDYLDDFPGLAPYLLARLIRLEISLRRRSAEAPAMEEYRQRFPHADGVIGEVAALDQQKTVDQETVSADRADDSWELQDSEDEQPELIGRYRVRRRLGRGGFGVVYLAHDPQLNRLVALKVPRSARLHTAEQVDLFVREARAAANLKHPGLVSVYDVQQWDGRWFIVQEYVPGKHLGRWAIERRPDYGEVAHVFASIAEALGAAHQHGLTHCDLKLSNVLIDEAGVPHVADFGLAVHESVRLSRKGERFGTPFMMAPEQVRGEGHRLDGRTDVWAVGVMLYQLLTQRRPFEQSEQDELFDQILTRDPKPPRQMDRRIPKELERICLKCLSKRRPDRYNTTDDLREDLLAWLQSAASEPDSSTRQDQARPGPALPPDEASSRSKWPIKVIPKGLRSFDDDDADFFLELLPGPRDRHNVPELVRFWKKRIEETDPDNTFSVGIIYGPSGCGKSSLFKAGVLPRLNADVLPIFLEASGSDTESRVLKQLRKQIPRLGAGENLVGACTQLRRGAQGTRQKTLLVIDQFEQWLHANKDRENTELARALRQADGEHLQCLLLLRDDFWMAATRFLRELEVNLTEGHNLAAVDLFSERHARHVLTAFGRAFAALPENPGELNQEQSAFVQQSVSELSENGKVVPVRLALFAEMMKNRDWVRQSLRDVGGARGVGEAFLEENLSSRSASPDHRLHEPAARGALRLLLPEVGTQIRGHMRSQLELADAAGYRPDSRDFAKLLRILDGELRLITPIDPESVGSDANSENGARFYQLTHDYLVSPLRVWLTAKQRETPRGRAELRLAELTAAWQANPEPRNLPSLIEWLWFLKHTRRGTRSSRQNWMISEATRRHAQRLCGWTVAVAFGVSSLWLGIRYAGQVAEQRRLEAMLAQIWTSELSHLPELVDRLQPRQDVWRAQVAAVASDASRGSADRTRAHLALASDPNHPLDYLVERLRRATRSEHQVMLEVLADRKAEAIPILEERLRSPKIEPSQLIRLASALALLGDPNEMVPELSSRLVDALVRSDPIEAARWSDALVPAHDHLIKPLIAAFQDGSRPATQRYFVASLISDIARGSPESISDQELSEVVTGASVDEYATLLPAVRSRSASVLFFLYEELNRSVGLEMTERNERLLSRQAIAAETIYRIGGLKDRSRFMTLLQNSRDPRLRTRLTGRLDDILEAQELVGLLKREKRADVRQALVLGLGEMSEAASAEAQELVRQTLTKLFLSDPDSGVHGASEWALRRAGHERLLSLLHEQAQPKEPSQHNWFVNREGQTMVQLEAPGEFVMGSPPWETGRDDRETERTVRIPYDFSISAHEVTVRQFLRFTGDHSYAKSVSPDRECPITSVSYEDAVAYCRWLTEREQAADSAQDAGALNMPGTEGGNPPSGGRAAYEYSLPTPNEWEYAVRAGTRTSRFFGNNPAYLDDYAWFGTTSKERTHRVGQRRPNPFGLFDVYGNVTEWCHGILDANGSKIPARGGNYRSTPKFLRSAMRVGFDPRARLSIVGFRIVRRPVDRGNATSGSD